jgi:hypothetical protein
MTKELKTDYILEIYEPNDESCVAGIHYSSMPFMNFSKGDYINPMMLNQAIKPVAVQITSVEHLFWEAEGSHKTHKLCLRTTNVGSASEKA